MRYYADMPEYSVVYFVRDQTPHSYTKNHRHPLEEILLLCTKAILSGAEYWEVIEHFGHAN
jgi:hypothetical protein